MFFRYLISHSAIPAAREGSHECDTLVPFEGCAEDGWMHT